MTLIDAVLVLSCGLGVARWPLTMPLDLMVIVMAALAGVFLQGRRRALTPAYAVGAVLLLTPMLPVERWAPWEHLAGMAAGMSLLAASIAGCLVFPVRRYPPSTGPHGIGTMALPAALIERFAPHAAPPALRPAPAARLWYPTARAAPQSLIGRLFLPRNRKPGVEGAAPAPAAAPFPVVLYFSGWPGTEIQNLVLIRELASRGFVVVSMIYPGRLPSMTDSDFARHVADFNAPYDFLTEAGARRTIQLFKDRVRRGAEDGAAMLDLLAAVNAEGTLPQFHGRLALDRAAVVGFSMGGGTAAQAGWLDPRFKAVVNLDGRHWNEALHDGVPRRYLYVSEILIMPTPADLASSNLDTRYNAELDQIDYVNVARNLERHGGVQVTLMGMSHMDFTDANLYSPLRRFRHGGTIDRFRALHIVNAYVGGFLERELRDVAVPLLDGDSSLFPEARVKVWPAS